MTDDVDEKIGELHRLGLLALQRNDPRRAVDLLDAAIALEPECAEAHYDRGNALVRYPALYPTP